MKLGLVDLLQCPTCGGSNLVAHTQSEVDGRCREGVLVCSSCRAWYPISGFVLDLLPEDRQPAHSRNEFFLRNRSWLEELEVSPPTEGTSEPDPSFRAQALQREHFDDVARRQDEFSYRALGELPFQRALRQITFGHWHRLVPPGALILDMGCADGVSTFDIARPDVEVLAFDISPQLIAQGASRAAEQGFTNVSFFIADADAIPLAPSSVDCVLCFGGLHHVPDPARTLAEAARVLREEGVYLGVENNTTPLRPVFDFLMRLRPLWLEEAGAEAQMGAADLGRWTAHLGLRIRTKSMVFVPPHLCNWLGISLSRLLLRLTDAVFGRFPPVRNWGGLIEIVGRRMPGP
jgi:ubiquinone/menaquinone biosynthesis C-methylase UbiE/uncharacterized protein YbaR (Trm112 family)